MDEVKATECHLAEYKVVVKFLFAFFIRIVTDELLATAFVAKDLRDQTTILAIKSHLARADFCHF